MFPGGTIQFTADALQDHPGDVSNWHNGLFESHKISCDLKGDINAWLHEEVAMRLRSIDNRLDHLVRLASRASCFPTETCSNGRDFEGSMSAKSSPSLHPSFQWDREPDEMTLDEASTLDGTIGTCKETELRITSEAPGEKVSVARSLSNVSKMTGLSALFHVSTLSHRSTKEQKLELIRERILTYQQFRGKHAAAMWRFFEDRYSGKGAFMYALFIPWFVACSVIFSFWETVDGFPLKGAMGEVLQSCFESVFALELLLRCLVCPDRCAFWRDPYNFIDFLSALPVVFRILFAIMSIFSDTSAASAMLSSIAVMPVLRLLKLMRRFEKFQLLLSAFIIAVEALPVLIYSLIVIALLFSALIYFVEPQDNIDSLPRALWFIIVTMTTVGYGDVTPATPAGHFVTILLLVISTLYMAMPIGIVGNAFSQAWIARDRLLLMHRMREAFLQQGFSANALENIVKMFDGDHDGELGFDEFVEMLEAMHIHMTDERVHMLLDSLDTDGSGKISVDELMTGLFPQDYAQLFANMSRATTNFQVRNSMHSCETNYSGHHSSIGSASPLERRMPWESSKSSRSAHGSTSSPCRVRKSRDKNALKKEDSGILKKEDSSALMKEASSLTVGVLDHSVAVNNGGGTIRSITL